VLVVDTSAVVAALVGRPPDRRLADRLGTDGDLHAPHLLDVELLHALRRLVRTGSLSADRAADARADFAELTVVRYGHEPLADRAWQLRDVLAVHDAMFIALAETLRVPLVTCVPRQGEATGHSAWVELFPGTG
jgi:predicted nucleic acid-binding protein